MKRILCVLLVVTLLVGVTGCGKKEKNLLGDYDAADSVVHNGVGALGQAA